MRNVFINFFSIISDEKKRGVKVDEKISFKIVPQLGYFCVNTEK